MQFTREQIVRAVEAVDLQYIPEYAYLKYQIRIQYLEVALGFTFTHAKRLALEKAFHWRGKALADIVCKILEDLIIVPQTYSDKILGVMEETKEIGLPKACYVPKTLEDKLEELLEAYEQAIDGKEWLLQGNGIRVKFDILKEEFIKEIKRS